MKPNYQNPNKDTILHGNSPVPDGLKKDFFSNNIPCPNNARFNTEGVSPSTNFTVTSCANCGFRHCTEREK